MARVELDIRDDINPLTALECVRKVIAVGKISQGEKGKMYYCWGTSFLTEDGEVWVYTRQYRKSDCFVIRKGRANG